MKIAVTSSGDGLTGEVDPRFGRAANFIIVDADTLQYEVVPNTQNFELPQGAGIQAGKTVVASGAEVLITGNCGPKAFRLLQHAGVKVVIGAKGQVNDMIERFRRGEFQATEAANVEGHWV